MSRSITPIGAPDFPTRVSILGKKAANRGVQVPVPIVEYLAGRHPAAWPRDGRARAWARCAAAEMHSGFSTLRNAWQKATYPLRVDASILDYLAGFNDVRVVRIEN